MRNAFYFALRSWSGKRSAETCEECLNLSIFSCLGPFLKFLGQVKEWLILDLHEMIRMSYVVAFPMVFNLLCDLGQQGGVLKLMKNDLFYVFLDVWTLFPKVLGRSRSSLY